MEPPGFVSGFLEICMDAIETVKAKVRYAESLLENERELLIRNPIRENRVRAVEAENRLLEARRELNLVEANELQPA